MIRQIQESEFSGPALTEGACLFHTPETIPVGQPIEWDCYDDDGLGLAKLAVFEIAGGTIFSLQYHEQLSRGDLMTVFVRPDDIPTHVDSVLTALGLTSADLCWLPAGVSFSASRLIRQDDNGVQFHVGDYPCRADAFAVILRLTAGAHKQTFFVEAIPGAGPSLSFPDDFGSPPTILPA